SPYAATYKGNPADLLAVREGRAAVQDAGSQLVAMALARADAPDGWWLDLCAGPGGKAGLLTGLAAERGERLIAVEVSPHRAELVARTLRAHVTARPTVICADGTRPSWSEGSFARVIADVPCSGLGALRRRPESRWRRTSEDVTNLVELQKALLHSAIDAAKHGGVIAYVTCSPHADETVGVVESVLADRTDVEVLDALALVPEVTDAAVGSYVQLWPHRHGTDAMFLALLRRV
ncbi:MAG: RsmB/NOP family class I SAM-dependent RNA methyltransferase, partial [Propionibacteriales bacterium]|nr:RsmB/NOP family class I SAM-dependent RNA methyltransferase [Propionibacteriales bacterium]